MPENPDEVVGGVEVRDEGEHEALDSGGVRGQLQVRGRGGAGRVERVRRHRPATTEMARNVVIDFISG